MTESDRLNVDIIKNGIGKALVGQEVLVFHSTASTNDTAWRYSKDSNNDGITIFAEKQTAGRGRRGNKWFSPSGQSILCSILLLNLDLQVEILSLIAAVAVGEAISNIGVMGVQLKWPNDIMIGGKKVAGILVESKPRKGKYDCVIGIGINCHQNENFFNDNKLQKPATSIDITLKKHINRNELAGLLLQSLDNWLSIAKKDSKRIIE